MPPGYDIAKMNALMGLQPAERASAIAAAAATNTLATVATTLATQAISPTIASTEQSYNPEPPRFFSNPQQASTTTTIAEYDYSASMNHALDGLITSHLPFILIATKVLSFGIIFLCVVVAPCFFIWKALERRAREKPGRQAWEIWQGAKAEEERLELGGVCARRRRRGRFGRNGFEGFEDVEQGWSEDEEEVYEDDSEDEVGEEEALMGTRGKSRGSAFVEREEFVMSGGIPLGDVEESSRYTSDEDDGPEWQSRTVWRSDSEDGSYPLKEIRSRIDSGTAMPESLN